MATSKWKTAMGNAIDAAKDSINDRGGLEGHEVQTTPKTRPTTFLQAAAGKRRQVVEYTVSPQRCKMWHYHNRLQDYITVENTAELIESIRVNGQRQAALARELKDDPDFDYELVYGARRRFACERLGIDLKIRVVHIDDRAALAEMDAENRPRKDISDYERSKDYRRWLDEGLYSSQNELGAAIGVSKSWLSRVLRLAEMPQPVVAAFASPLDLKIEYGYELAKTIEDSESKKQLVAEAHALTGKNLQAGVVYRRLMAAAKRRTRQPRGVIETVTNEQGAALFKVARDRNGMLQFRFEKVAKERPREEIERAVLDALKRYI